MGASSTRSNAATLVDSYRLAYLEEVAVNWCPALGTVLANEEVTAEGRSERGNHPCTSARSSSGCCASPRTPSGCSATSTCSTGPSRSRSCSATGSVAATGADIVFPVEGHEDLGIRVFTTRPDTVFGATYMVLAPELDLVDEIVRNEWPPRHAARAWRGTFGTDVSPVGGRRGLPRVRGDEDRPRAPGRRTGRRPASSPARSRSTPSTTSASRSSSPTTCSPAYGTGAIMAVPGQDQRDWDFAEEFDLPIVRTVQPPPDFDGQAYLGDGPAINSGFLDGLNVDDAKRGSSSGSRRRTTARGAVTYKLRDWLFSRQRYWGEPFPIVYDETGLPVALPESMLPVELPEIERLRAPHRRRRRGDPARAAAGARRALGHGRARPRRRARRRTCARRTRCRSGRDRAGTTCATSTRPTRTGSSSPRSSATGCRVDTSRSGGVDLYVGGVEHAVLHLLYARFWHKVLFDLGHVSTPEPFAAALQPGHITAYEYIDERGMYVDGQRGRGARRQVLLRGQARSHASRDRWARAGRTRSRPTTSTPTTAPTRSGSTRCSWARSTPAGRGTPTDIVGVHRFLQRFWRNVVDEETGAMRVCRQRRPTRRPVASCTARSTAVRADMGEAPVQHRDRPAVRAQQPADGGGGGDGRGAARGRRAAMTLMLAPLAPHIGRGAVGAAGARRVAARTSRSPSPTRAYLVEEEVEIPVQVDGKVRARVKVPAGASEAEHEAAAARRRARVARLLEGEDACARSSSSPAGWSTSSLG